MRLRNVFMVAMLAQFGMVACTKKSEETAKTESSAATGEKVVKDGVTVEDLTVGSGDAAVAGKQVQVHYTGWLQDEKAADGKGQKFDSSVDRGQAFGFGLGSGMVIRGWEIGVEGMKVGGKRKLTIPADKGYGERGAGGVIPPNATLIFEVELLGVGA